MAELPSTVCRLTIFPLTEISQVRGASTGVGLCAVRLTANGKSGRRPSTLFDHGGTVIGVWTVALSPFENVSYEMMANPSPVTLYTIDIGVVDSRFTLPMTKFWKIVPATRTAMTTMTQNHGLFRIGREGAGVG